MTDSETEHIKNFDLSELDEQNRLLYEIVVRLSALEIAVVKSKVISETDLAEAQIGCMQKIKDALNKYAQTTANEQPTTGFVKYGGKFEDYDWSHESDDGNKK